MKKTKIIFVAFIIVFLLLVPLITVDTGVRCITVPCPSTAKAPILIAFWKNYLSETKFGCTISNSDDCWDRYAGENTDINSCLKIKNDRQESNCVSGIVVRERDGSLCDYLTDKRDCLVEAAQTLHEDNYCQRAGITDIDSAQSYMKGGYCYGYAVIKSKRYDLCNEIFFNTQREECLNLKSSTK